jgi:hypothetical protein
MDLRGGNFARADPELNQSMAAGGRDDLLFAGDNV